MKILWLCNVLPPMVANKLNMQGSGKEGWISGTLSRFIAMADGTVKENPDSIYATENNGKPSEIHRAQKEIQLSLAFPVDSLQKEKYYSINLSDNFTVKCFGYYENTNMPENYCLSMEAGFKAIIEELQPDIVHVFGTEYGHTLAMARVIKELEKHYAEKTGANITTNGNTAESLKKTCPPKLLIGIQGVISKCGEEYTAELPYSAIHGLTFRDLIKKDNISRQQAKFLERGEMEKEAIALASNVTGRTAFDESFVKSVNPDARYYFMNETLREVFYTGQWELEKCSRHSIFISQGDYPLKGLHILIEAMAKIAENFPDAVIYVAGADITAYGSLKEKIKIGSYGKYLRKLTNALGLSGKVIFTGRLDEKQMKEMYLKCHTYVCASSLENSPNSMGEAMLLGVPVVASRVGGIPSLIEENIEGLLFEAGNSEGLADNIIRLWNDDDLAISLGKKGRERAITTHNGDVNYNRLLEIYCEIL